VARVPSTADPVPLDCLVAAGVVDRPAYGSADTTPAAPAQTPVLRRAACSQRSRQAPPSGFCRIPGTAARHLRVGRQSARPSNYRCFAASLIAVANAAAPPNISVKTGLSLSTIRAHTRMRTPYAQLYQTERCSLFFIPTQHSVAIPIAQSLHPPNAFALSLVTYFINPNGAIITRARPIKPKNTAATPR
jgi:hypothetical protein